MKELGNGRQAGSALTSIASRTRRREGTGIEVHEEELGTVTAQRLFKMRCECGRSWFERTIRIGNAFFLRNKDAVENRFRAEVVQDSPQQVESVKRILSDLKLAEIPTLLVLNKADLLESEELDAVLRQAKQFDKNDPVVISALRPATLDRLLDRVGLLLARDLGLERESDFQHRHAVVSEVA